MLHSVETLIKHIPVHIQANYYFESIFKFSNFIGLMVEWRMYVAIHGGICSFMCGTHNKHCIDAIGNTTFDLSTYELQSTKHSGG